ncbi:MAG TPA: BON domain-containing protein, partial [Longimicrobiaceae bacterium]|nr:BON domain-containing protein [Longimicrobiaceae bacterium]
MPQHYRPGPSRYDGDFRSPAAFREHGPGGVRPRPDFGREGDFRPHPGLGGGRPGADESFAGDGSAWEGGVYGPARYGLGPYHHRLRNRRRPDEELKQEVEEALFYDTWVDAEAITVEVKDGVVTLRGELPDYDEVRYATDDAWDVDGVRGVRSELTVNPGKRPPLDFPGGRRGQG